MPRIPTSSRQVGIKVGNVPEMNLPEMGTGAISRSQQAQKEVINAIENVENMLIQVRDFRETNEASVYHSEKSRELESRAQQDPNLDPNKYAVELDKITLEASKSISGRLAKEAFMAKAKQRNIVTNYGIKDLYRTQQIDGAKAIVLLKKEQLINDYGGLTDIQKHDAVADWKTTLNDALNRGIYSKAEIVSLDLKTQGELRRGEVEYGILNDPWTTKAELQKGNDGEYPGLTQTERINSIKEAEMRIEKLNNQKEEAIAIASNQRESELINLKIAEILTVPMVKKERELENISARFADSMIKALENPKVGIRSKDETYIDFQNRVMDLQAKGNKATLEEIAQLMSDTMEAHAKNLLDKDDVQRILKDRNILLQKKLENVVEDILTKINPKNLLQRISFWSDEYAPKRPEIKARMYRKLMDGITQGKDANELLKNIISNELDNHLAEQAQKPNRQYAINPETKQCIYSENGGVTWRDEKTGRIIK